MKKKNKIKKLVKQTMRNHIINKRYLSIIKTIKRKLNLKILVFKTNPISNLLNFIELKTLLSNYYSILDKAAKKNVIHINHVNKKKAHFGKLIFLLQ
jgi:small subunit ribosomal protein S20